MNFKKPSFLLFLATCFVAQAQQSPYLTSPDSSKQWVFQSNMSDEFNNGSIDYTNKWFYNTNLPNVNAWKWNNAANVKIVNNAAVLKMNQNTNNVAVNGTYFNSGILKTRGTFTTGFIEAKIKGAVINVPGVNNGKGVCPSFWLYSDFKTNAAEGQTVYSEIDVVELQQFDYYNGVQDDIFDMDLNLHMVLKENGNDVWYRPKPNAATQKNHYTASFNPTLGYHIYGCEVNETEIIWYVDGAKVASKPNTHWNLPMNVTLSLGLRVPFVQFMDNKFNPIDPTADATALKQLAGMPASMSVDYVRVWKKATATVTTPSTPITTGNYNGVISVFLDQSKDTMSIVMDNFQGNTQISMFDMSGNQVLNTSSSLSTIVLPTNSYPNAPYILNVVNANGKFTQKIFVK